MRPEDILRWTRRAPFVPFRIHLSNGQTFDVVHPEFVTLFRSSLQIVRSAPDLPEEVFDDYTTIALVHINHIDAIPATAPPAAS